MQSNTCSAPAFKARAQQIFAISLVTLGKKEADGREMASVKPMSNVSNIDVEGDRKKLIAPPNRLGMSVL
jgi:hypothetical protein